MLSCSVGLVAMLATAAAFDTVAVCPPALRPSLEPWLAYRAAQGHQIAVVSAEGAPGEIRARIREAAGRSAKYLLIVGDAPSLSSEQGGQPTVPFPWLEAKVNLRYGGLPHIGSDNWYADLDGDGSPELAAGRWTIDTADELAAIIRKTLAYEQSRDFGAWRRRVSFVAGSGGFGGLADAVLESTARYFLSHSIPASYDVTMTYASCGSAYCPQPERFRDTAVERFSEGCLFWIYMGHGDPLALAPLRTPQRDYPVFELADARRLECQHGPPVAVILSCYAGALDAAQDCLAEEMLRAPGGPCAVLAASRVTMPYGTAVLARELAVGYFATTAPTFGELVMHAKRRCLDGAAGGAERLMLDALAGVVSPTRGQLADERAEQVMAFNLLGDPLLRLRNPAQVDLEISLVDQGRQILVRGRSPVAGNALFEIVRPRDAPPGLPDREPNQPATAGLDSRMDAYRRANDGRIQSIDLHVELGPFSVALPAPDGVTRCDVRVFIAGTDDFAMGSARLELPAAAAESQDGKNPGREEPGPGSR